MLRRLLLSTGTALLLAACATKVPLNGEQQAQQALQHALGSPARQAEARARDSWRHPLQTLLFFGYRPDMTVVEIWPGAGWYTDILGPATGEKGRLYAAHFPTATNVPFYQKTRTAYEERLRTMPWASRVTLTEFLPQSDHKIAPDGSADLVVTFRNVHNWYMQGGDVATADAFRQFHAALKPGGVLGMVDHRLPESRPDFEMVASGYMKQSYIIKQAVAAGFTLEATSEINANPRDTADHPKGVWTLPPTLRLGEQDRDKYLAIGESDRMTLKFRKPNK
jgi:predicted methyltransferase